jgi:hypothetical protein
MCKMCCNLGSKTVHAPFHLLPALFLLVSRPAISIHLPPLVLPSLLNNCQIINKLIRLFRGQSSNLPGLSLRPEPEPEPVLVLGPWPWPCLCRIRFPALHCTLHIVSSTIYLLNSDPHHTPVPQFRGASGRLPCGPHRGGAYIKDPSLFSASLIRPPNTIGDRSYKTILSLPLLTRKRNRARLISSRRGRDLFVDCLPPGRPPPWRKACGSAPWRTTAGNGCTTPPSTTAGGRPPVTPPARGRPPCSSSVSAHPSCTGRPTDQLFPLLPVRRFGFLSQNRYGEVR